MSSPETSKHIDHRIRRMNEEILEMGERMVRIQQGDLHQSQRAASLMLIKLAAESVARIASHLLLSDVRPVEGENLLDE